MRSTRTTLAIVGATCVLILLIASRIRPAEVEAKDRTAPFSAQAKSSTTPTIQVYSRETLVDVTVTDAQGHPVRGLKQSDFTISEDGSPQSIRSFQEFGTRTTTAARTLPKLPPNVYTNLQPASGPLNVLLLDYINGTSFDEVRAARFIKSLPPGTQGAVLALGMKLNVLQGPTSDPSLLLKAVTRYVEPFAVMAIACNKQDLENWATIDQMNQVAAYLSGIAGRKNLLWIGTGIPTMIIPVVPCAAADQFQKPLSRTYARLADAEVTLYPVDPSGVGNLGARQLSMEAVAEATGGVAYYETNDIGNAIAQAVGSGSSYYTLSYVPPNPAYDGRHHAIGITVNRPGIHLVYRKGYDAEDPIQLARTTATGHPEKTPESKADTLAAAMAPVAPPATQLLFDVRAEPSTTPPSPIDPPILGALNPKLGKAPLTRYSFLFAVPASQIAFTSAAGGTYTGSLEFDVAAFDPDGRLITIRSQTMKLPLTAAEYRQFIATPFKFFQQLDLPPGPLTLRVGILDGVSNKVGTLEIPVTVPKK